MGATQEIAVQPSILKTDISNMNISSDETFPWRASVADVKIHFAKTILTMNFQSSNFAGVYLMA